MNIAITISWPLLAAIVATGAVIAWLYTRDVEGDTFGVAGLFYSAVAAIVVLIVWLAYFAARVVWGF